MPRARPYGLGANSPLRDELCKRSMGLHLASRDIVATALQYEEVADWRGDDASSDVRRAA